MILEGFKKRKNVEEDEKKVLEKREKIRNDEKKKIYKEVEEYMDV